MFKKAEITQMTRKRDADNKIYQIISRVVIYDDIYGNLYTEFVCEGDEVFNITNLESKEEQKVAYEAWITPKIQETYNAWFNSKNQVKDDVLMADDILNEFGHPPSITALPE